MKESTNEEPIDFSQFNQFKQKSKQDNIEIQDPNQIYQIIIVIHFSSSKTFSFKVPHIWTTKKLLSFISLTFKSELKNSIPIFLYQGNIMQSSSEIELKEYLNLTKANHIIITLKQKDLNSSKEDQKNNKNILDNIYSKSNKEVFKTDEFCDMERNIMTDYSKIFKEESFNNFPLMSPAYNKRREQIKYDPQTERLAQFEPVPLEDFPIRNYFQLKIIFKCIISFFALGIYIKGFNFILFLCVLVIYYWYCINNIIEDFYKQKFQEIGLNEEEYKRIGREIKDIGKKFGSFVVDKEENEEAEEENESEEDNKEENVNKDENDKEREDIIYEEKSDENISNNNINKEASNNLKFEEDMKDIDFKEENNNIINEPMKDLNFNEEDKKEEINKENIQDNNNSPKENNNNINTNNDRIKNIKKNKKKELKKEREEREEREEPEQETPLQIAYQIIYLFFISFIPPWCDEFEAHNPMPSNNQPRQNGNNDNNNNHDNQNNNNNENNNINNENNINNNLFNDINNDINDNNIGQQSSNSPPQEEDSNNNKMTSSKVANISEDSSRENRMYNLIKKDNQSLNEKEYVFSENGGIDSLSMNSELFKQKKEKEKEKEKENKDDKENKEKEKQIFEEDEKEVKEEDKHLKNE